MSNSIGDRIKRYERASSYSLPPRTCLFIRVDGRAFHTFTKKNGCKTPFDRPLMACMDRAAVETSREMMGFKLGYVQSDEATFMLTDFDRNSTQGWFGYELNKVVSLSASIFTGWFNTFYHPDFAPAAFDARAFTVPLEDAANVFIWRQRDWERNSLQMVARAHFSHRECTGKKRGELHDMLMDKGINWSTNYSGREKNGAFILADRDQVHKRLDYADITTYIEQQLHERSTDE